jgi:hypothetical protein
MPPALNMVMLNETKHSIPPHSALMRSPGATRTQLKYRYYILQTQCQPAVLRHRQQYDQRRLLLMPLHARLAGTEEGSLVNTRSSLQLD